MRHFVYVAILVVVVTLLVYAGLSAIGLMPTEASLQSIPIDQLFNLEVITISFLFSLIVVPLGYSLIVFRRKPGDANDGEHLEGNTRLEVTWTIIPLVIVLTFAYLGARALGETRRADPQAMEIHVTAFQWGWKFDYPTYGVSGATDLYMPVNKQVVFKMESLDVIHSFFVPEFRMKQDVVPGRETELRVTPIEIGDYKVRCAELCGASHAYMLAPVHVVSQADFDAWIQGQLTAATQAVTSGPDPARGQQLAQANGCLACHSTDGSKIVGPTWKGLFNSQVNLSDGTTVTADEAYLQESIHDPNAKVVAGFEPNVMPQFSLSDAQVADLVAFIKTLK